MMEQSYACECHCDAILVACVDDMVVTNATSSLSNVLNTALVCTFDIVAEAEECVGTQCHLGVAGYPVLSLLGSEWLWLLGKEQLPRPLLQDVLVFIRYIDIDGIVAVGTSDALP